VSRNGTPDYEIGTLQVPGKSQPLIAGTVILTVEYERSGGPLRDGSLIARALCFVLDETLSPWSDTYS
jgi:hypothetical protein